MGIRENNIAETIKDIEAAITRDNIIIQTVHTIDETSKCVNRLTVCLRERYGLYAPLTAKLREEDFMQRINEIKKEEMGIDLKKEDLESIKQIIIEIKELKKFNDKQEQYLTNLMNDICPRLLETATAIIGARLIDYAGSLKRLAELPSSTIQVLGAEKALFRHLKSKSKTPKFGVIFAHKQITEAENKGKTARQLASKISIATKIDYFKHGN